MASKNVVLITIDCLRANHLSCYGYKRKTSPFMDFLSAEGMKFENAFANGPFTAAAFLSILASAYPLEFNNQLPLPPDAILVSTILQTKGFRTAAVHSNPYLSAFYGYNRGWTHFQDFLHSSPIKDIKITGGFKRSIKTYLPNRLLRSYRLSYRLIKNFFGFTHSPYQNAETITKYAVSWLKENKDAPFFLWLHYMDLHEPYWIFDTKFNRKYSKTVSRLSRVKMLENAIHSNWNTKTIGNIIDVYDDKLRYVDKNLMAFFRLLNREGLIDHTLIILTSDHGQELLDHGSFSHKARFYDEILHIPLILFGPRIKNQVNTKLVSQLDITPTILNWLDITIPKGYRGDPLFEASSRFVISEAAHNEKGVYISGHKIFPSNLRTYAIRTKNWKYIRGDKQRKLYNLLENPKEKENVIGEEREKAEEFESIIQKHMMWEKYMRKQRATASEKERINKIITKIRLRGKKSL